jgi:DNA topoisomerase-1
MSNEKNTNKKKKKCLLFVESPGKCPTIKKYLSDDENCEYDVVATIGHIKQLPSKPGSIVFDDNKEIKFLWEGKADHIKKLSNMLKEKSYDTYYIATDKDREGEGIAYHVYEFLKEHNVKGEIHRITFNEITKKAIQDSIKEPRNLDYNLIHAFLSRLATDYLIGYTLSPVTWKLGKYSVGRVQSPGVKLVIEQEKVILNFVPQTYYFLEGVFENLPIKPKVFYINKKIQELFKLQEISDEKKALFIDLINKEDFDEKKIPSEELTDTIREILLEKKHLEYLIEDIIEKDISRSPIAPFTTVTMQQEANSKLNYGAQITMRNAQKLYEEGLITYMRTDSTILSDGAVNNIREYINNTYGKEYLSKVPLNYKSKIKNAQEAHEAIRPTDIKNNGSGIEDTYLKGLYELIWRRTVACQMSDALYKKKDIILSNDLCKMNLSGSQLVFLGYLKVYGREEDEDNLLPNIEKNTKILLTDMEKNSYTTKASPRYSEGSLIKQLEKKGIGRPSTYVGIIEILKNREYVKVEGKALVGIMRGKILITFLEKYFPKYIDYDFTANMEEDLDRIANGEKEWKDLLYNFYKDLQEDYQKVKNINVFEILDELKAPLLEWNKNIKCDKCGSEYNLYIKSSLFFSCSNKECKNTTSLKDDFNFTKITTTDENGETKVYKKFYPKKKFIPKKFEKK